MKSLFTLKEISRISKSKLTMAVGLTENYSRIIYEYKGHEDVKSDEGGEVREGVIWDRRGINTIKCTQVRVKDGLRIEVIETMKSRRLSRLQLLQYILYHFLTIDSNGIVKNVSSKDIAGVLNCSVNTINNNNEVLCRLGFISLARVDADILNVEIIGYKDNRKTKDQGGTGYIQMPKEMLLKMIFINDVNVLRLTIRQLIKCDSREGIYNSPSAEYTFKDYKFFLPKNLGLKSRILKTLEYTSEFFIHTPSNHGVEFTLKDQYNGKKQKKRKEAIYQEEILGYLHERNAIDLEDNTKDLIQLSMEYGTQYIKGAIDSYLSSQNPSSIKNIGGFLREHIRSHSSKTS